MATVSQLMARVRLLCSVNGTEPTQEVLSDSHILTTLNDFQLSLSATQIMSQQNQWLEFQMLGTPQRNTELSIVNFNSLVMVEFQVDPVYDRWNTLPIVNRVDINTAENEGRWVCAVAGTPPVLSFSFVPSVTFPAYPFRIWYETTPADNLPANTPRLNPLFYNLVTMLTASFLREVVLGLPVPPTMQSAIARCQEQYDEYANRSTDQRAQMRPAAYGTEDIAAAYEPFYWV